MKKQDFKVLKTKDLYPFPDNPFHVAEDETLSELAESIKGWHIAKTYVDDGYSGTNFQRPSFQNMIKDIEAMTTTGPYRPQAFKVSSKMKKNTIEVISKKS